MYSFESLQNGTIILIDKPINLTSFTVVSRIRYYLCNLHKIKKIKIGHAGTLDPKATGLLVLVTGNLTKKIFKIQQTKKKYIGTLKLGFQTESYDSETNEVFPRSIEKISKKDIINTTKIFVGKINQIPPMYSAIKKNGIRMYTLARKGIQEKISKRKIDIYKFNISKINLPFVDFEVECSVGTYIRSLVKDYGDSLGCGAYLTQLRRIKSGKFHINNAFNLENLIQKIKNSKI